VCSSDLNLQLVRDKLFQQSDTLILSRRQTEAQNSIVSYDETMLLVSHRLIFATFRVRSQIRQRTRDTERSSSTAGSEKRTRIKPTLEFDYRKYKDINIIFNIKLEDWKYSGNTNNDNYTRTSFEVGYQWTF